jgi:hypothetical protein
MLALFEELWVQTVYDKSAERERSRAEVITYSVAFPKFSFDSYFVEKNKQKKKKKQKRQKILDASTRGHAVHDGPPAELLAMEIKDDGFNPETIEPAGRWHKEHVMDIDTFAVFLRRLPKPMGLNKKLKHGETIKELHDPILADGTYHRIPMSVWKGLNLPVVATHSSLPFTYHEYNNE